MSVKRRRKRQTNTDLENIDYKNIDLLMNYVSHQGRILGRKYTGFTAKKQRQLGKAIRRARALGLMPFVIRNAF